MLARTERLRAELGRYKQDGEVINFRVHYEIDDNTSSHVLKLRDVWRRGRGRVGAAGGGAVSQQGAGVAWVSV